MFTEVEKKFLFYYQKKEKVSKIVVTCRGTYNSPSYEDKTQSLKADHPGIERSTSRTRNGRPATELLDPAYFKIKFYIWQILKADCYI